MDGRLQKLKTLSERGSPGEKENAAALLKKLCDKYKVSIDEIGTSDKIETHWFKYKRGPYSKKLLNQCIYKTMGHCDRYRRTFLKDLEIGVDCSIAQGIEIELNFAFFSNALEEEIERLYNMFIQKNDIFYPNVKVSTPEHSTITHEDILMYQSIKRKTRVLQIEEAQ